MSLLEVKDLRMIFPVHGGVLLRKIAEVFAVDGVSFSLEKGKTLGIVGESGCGKSTLGKAVLQLLTPTSGEVLFEGKSLTGLNRKGMRPYRRQIQMIFQDPYESLNPRMTVAEILAEPFHIHSIKVDSLEKELKKLLNTVGLPESAMQRYPHEFSGGQRQRIGIARAIALKPKLILCDEPVSALDVSIQSQILNLLVDLQRELKLSYLFIAHGLAAVKHVSDDVMVMYLGKAVEIASAEKIYRSPAHPYTRALLEAIPIANPHKRKNKTLLMGEIPSPRNPPSGCRFHTRCPLATQLCKKEEPKLLAHAEGHLSACHYPLL